LGRVGSLDDLDGPVTLTLEGIAQFAARIAAIGEDVAQPWKPVADGLEQRRGSVAILHIGRMAKSMMPSVSVTMWRLRPLTFFPAS